MPNPAAFVIVNANARHFVRSPPLVDRVVRLVGGRAHVAVTRSRDDLSRAARLACDRGARVVVLCGGDGTYGAAATALMTAYGDSSPPALALAPGGTVGTVPRALGVHAGGVAEGIARVVHAACAVDVDVDPGSTFATPTLCVEADGRRRIAFIFGTGLVSAFFELYDRSGARADGDDLLDAPSEGGGYVAAAAMVARVFVESLYGGRFARRVLEPMRCDVVVDGATLPWTRSSLVLAATVSDLGLGMRVTYRAGEDRARPHVVVSGLPPRILGPRVFRVLRGVAIGSPGEPHFDDLARELVVELFPMGRYVVDGDLRSARSVRVTAGPMIEILRLAPLVRGL